MFFRIVEFQLLLFAFFVNLFWEAAQARLFVFKEQSSFASLTRCLLFCSSVDAVMMLLAFWVVSAFAKNRCWFLASKYYYTVAFVTTGLILSFVSEYSVIHYRKLWEYSKLMPVIPGLELGLAPLLQWLFMPPLVLFLLVRGFR